MSIIQILVRLFLIPFTLITVLVLSCILIPIAVFVDLVCDLCNGVDFNCWR